MQDMYPQGYTNSLHKVQRNAVQNNKLKLIVDSKRDVHPKLKPIRQAPQPQKFHEPEPKKLIGRQKGLLHQEIDQTKDHVQPVHYDEPMANQQNKFDNKKLLKKDLRKKGNDYKIEDKSTARTQNTSQAPSTKGHSEMVSTLSETQNQIQPKQKKH